MDGPTIVKIVEPILKERGISKNEFYKGTGIKSATFSQWRNGQYSPSASNLERIESFLKIKFDYSISEETKKATAPEGDGSSNPDFDVFLKAYEGLSPAKQSLVQSLVRELASAEARADDSQD